MLFKQSHQQLRGESCFGRSLNGSDPFAMLRDLWPPLEPHLHFLLGWQRGDRLSVSVTLQQRVCVIIDRRRAGAKGNGMNYWAEAQEKWPTVPGDTGLYCLSMCVRSAAKQSVQLFDLTKLNIQRVKIPRTSWSALILVWLLF